MQPRQQLKKMYKAASKAAEARGFEQAVKAADEAVAVLETELQGPPQSWYAAGTIYAKTPEAADWLIARGAELEAVDEEGRTPLRAAVDCADVQLVHTLLRHGANPQRADTDDRTPLDIAQESELDELRAIAKLLVSGRA